MWGSLSSPCSRRVAQEGQTCLGRGAGWGGGQQATNKAPGLQLLLGGGVQASSCRREGWHPLLEEAHTVPLPTALP